MQIIGNPSAGYPTTVNGVDGAHPCSESAHRSVDPVRDVDVERLIVTRGRFVRMRRKWGDEDAEGAEERGRVWFSGS